MAEFKRLDFPRLFFLPLHEFEVAKAVLFWRIEKADRLIFSDPKHLMQEWADALMKNDQAAIDRIESDDWMLTDPEGLLGLV